MKKFFVVLFMLILMVPLTLFAETESTEKGKVKVYVFEAGGCPYCEAETEYFKSLEGYNKTFEIVSKELYVDHVEWKQGKDYELGKKVAEAFLEAGFENASYQGTPFVVISDLYAAATYSTDLESIINQAYEEGDTDAVSCIGSASDNGLSCIREGANVSSNTSEETDSKAGIVVAVLALVVFVGVVVYLLSSKNSRVVSEEDEEFNDDKVYDKALDGMDTPGYGKTPKKKGYKFDGWDPEVSEKVKGDQVYKAKWKEDKNENGIADEDEYRTITYSTKLEKGKSSKKTTNNTNKKRTSSSNKKSSRK